MHLASKQVVAKTRGRRLPIGRHGLVGKMRRAAHWLVGVVVSLWIAKADAAAKNPVIKWGQKSDKLYLTIPLPDLEEPEIKLEEKRVSFAGKSRGQNYAVKLKLLRGINVTESKHTINKWSVSFELQKLKKEPCWKRLLKPKETFTWLKKDHDRWYADSCQHAKELWREAYFSAKLNGDDPNRGAARAEDSGGPPPQMEKERDKKQWDKMLKEFRSRAVPRQSSKKAKGKKA